MYIYIYIHIHAYVYVYICVYTCMHACMHSLDLGPSSKLLISGFTSFGLEVWELRLSIGR